MFANGYTVFDSGVKPGPLNKQIYVSTAGLDPNKDGLTIKYKFQVVIKKPWNHIMNLPQP